jgi:hypothetical protein
MALAEADCESLFDCRTQAFLVVEPHAEAQCSGVQLRPPFEQLACRDQLLCPLNGLQA